MADNFKISQIQLSSLGEYIRSHRIKKGVGLREMAGILNISSAYLSNIESGKHSKANPLILKRIEEV